MNSPYMGYQKHKNEYQYEEGDEGESRVRAETSRQDLLSRFNLHESNYEIEKLHRIREGEILREIHTQRSCVKCLICFLTTIYVLELAFTTLVL